jgi:hypothetical protein
MPFCAGTFTPADSSKFQAISEFDLVPSFQSKRVLAMRNIFPSLQLGRNDQARWAFLA